MNLDLVQPFQLVEFLQKGPKKLRPVDCVPTKWIRYDSLKKRYVSKFMPPPYTDKTNAILYKLVECELDAPDHWQEYSVKLVGDGQTYAKAVDKLAKLKTQEYAYSSASEMHSKDKAAAVAKEIKARDNLPNFQSIMDVPTLTEKSCGPRKKVLSKSPSIDERISPVSSNEEFDTENDAFENFHDDRSSQEFIRKPELAKSIAKKKQFYKADSIPYNKKKRQSTSEESSIDFDSTEKSFERNNNDIFSNIEEINTGIKDYQTKNKPSKPKLMTASKSSDNTEKKHDLVIREIRGLKAEIRELKDKIVTLVNMFETVACTNYVSKESFAAQYNLKLPFQTLEEFTEFDNQLKTNEKCCKEFKGSLALSFDKKLMRKTVNNIFKKYFSKNMGSQFTAVRKNATKHIFKEYHMCACIINVLAEKYKCSEDEVVFDISTVLSNVKDWDGGRKSRQGKNNDE